MGYTKLFAEILDSTVWREPTPTRLVWITMLAMADRNGEIMASVPGLSDRARVSLDDCQSALSCFLGPDKWSRSKERQGQRIEEIDGGWRLINFEKFRLKMGKEEQREKVAERVRRYRERAKRERTVPENCECCGASFGDLRNPKTMSLYVTLDHNHSTGQVRGFICKSCNKIVGDIEGGRPTATGKHEECLRYIDRYVTDSNQCNPTRPEASPDQTRPDQTINNGAAAPPPDGGFEAFWKATWKVGAKGDAEKAWKVHGRPSAEQAASAIAAYLAAKKQSGQGLAGVGVWLRAGGAKQTEWNLTPIRGGAAPARPSGSVYPTLDAKRYDT